MNLLRCANVLLYSVTLQMHGTSAFASQSDSMKNKSDFACIASTYNPFKPGNRSGGRETASGELYDPAAWTAAIQTGLRDRFAGVRYGTSYRATYVLVSSLNKRAIVKVNDVGPLKPGRVIDLNEQTMRYFDPSMQTRTHSRYHHAVE